MPTKFLAALAVLAIASIGVLAGSSNGLTYHYVGWPAKWYVPELDSDWSSQVISPPLRRGFLPPSPGQFVIVKHVDETSPSLKKAVAKRLSFARATLETPYGTWQLKEVAISKYSSTEPGLEQFTISYRTLSQ
jgi:hypothetical protein